MTTDKKQVADEAQVPGGIYRIDESELTDLHSLADGEEQSIDDLFRMLGASPPPKPTAPPEGRVIAMAPVFHRPDATPPPAAVARFTAGQAAMRAVEPAVEQELVQARAKVDRLTSNIDDLRKRAQRERDETERFGNERLIRALLPSIDNLERAIDHARQSRDEPKSLLDGVRMVHRQILQDLVMFGVEPFESVGQPFDPSVHEAAQQVSNPNYAPGVVVAQFKRGYRLHDRLLRPAMVVVNQGQPARPALPDDGPEATGE